MSNYALVENGKVIKGPCSLPKAWKNISNLHMAEAQVLRDLGWLPVEEDIPIHDPDTETLSDPTLEVLADKVIRHRAKKAIPATTLARQEIEITKGEAINVLADLITILIQKGAIANADFSAESQATITKYKNAKQVLAG